MINISLVVLIIVYFSIVKAIFDFKSHKDAKKLAFQSGKIFEESLREVIEENAIIYFITSLFWVILLPVEFLGKIIFNFLNKYIK